MAVKDGSALTRSPLRWPGSADSLARSPLRLPGSADKDPYKGTSGQIKRFIP